MAFKINRSNELYKKVFLYFICIIFIRFLLAEDNSNSLGDRNVEFYKQRNEYIDFEQSVSNITPTLENKLEIKQSQLPLKNDFICFEIDEIFLRSNVPVLQKKIENEFSFLKPILKSYSHQCLDTRKIGNLLNELKLKAFKEGYITTFFGIQPQDISSKKLIIFIQTSILKEILYDDGDNVVSLFWGKDYSITIGDIFSIRPIDRGLYNFKRLRTLNPTIEISSTKAPTNEDPIESKIIINHHKSFLPLFISLSGDNAGSNSTGIYQNSFQLGLENYFSLAEAFHFYTVLTPQWGKSHSIYTSADFSIPFRRFLFYMSSSYSHYIQNIPVGKNIFDYSGYSANMDIKGEYLLYLDAINRFNISIGLGKRWSKNYLEDIELIPQRRNLTNIYANVSYSRLMAKSSFNFSLGVKQGVKFFGAMGNLSDSPSEPNFFYTVPTVDIYLYTPLRVGGQSFAYTGFLKTQVSRTRLYASEKFGLGGIYSVRGFDSLVLNGEMGVLNRNDFSYYLPSFFKISLAPTLGFDMGYTTDLYTKAQNYLGNQGFLIGGGLGLKAYWSKYFNFQIWGYMPIYNPNKLKERYFYASFGLNWQ
ncbi:ShlB/FhaC/HecB family hemolysin secretion/activation protein [Helicobacter sp. 13S00477-4]|uniref:ShlB/FhaC/HecB family hemolysin secretion/activation protein n=1 Tax=Helicobacter sp. 13S00477-4 TaxID=1905759 RepID=UPI000BA713DD|nr:ShlB/FhaC/HecB family hemolysin secretion/activation protein [Helicobacter sp. 13S00477-4]PAF51969.1 hypothetical protein BKH44_04735 [Helicobacter sp. 13S00477-4]